MHVDVIGAGMAGLSTAISIKKLDSSISVAVYEKHKKIGYNADGRRCGEAFFSEKDNPWIPTDKSVFNHIYQSELIIGNKTYYDHFPESKSPVYMLNKPAFICQLADEAERYNVSIKTNTKISKITDLSADIIVDASGCPSIIKKSLNLDYGMKGLTYQETLTDCNKFHKNRITLYYFGRLGYYWIFPRNPFENEVNIGVGLLETRQEAGPKLLQDCKNKINITGKPVHYTGGVIPLGLQRPFRIKNILFVGDAGVGTFTYLGEGIRRALSNGEIAAHCIVNNQINKYSRLMMKEFFLWDFIGRCGIKTSKVLSYVSEDAMFFLLHRYFDFINAHYNLTY
jgi:flavin-dependent dehydrogenase